MTRKPRAYSLVIQHVYLGKSRDHAWCGLYVGFHHPRPAIVESDFRDRREKGLGANICRNCRRSFEAEERRSS